MSKITFDVLQDGDTVVMIGKAKNVKRMAQPIQDVPPAPALEDRHEYDEDHEDSE